MLPWLNPLSMLNICSIWQWECHMLLDCFVFFKKNKIDFKVWLCKWFLQLLNNIYLILYRYNKIDILERKKTNLFCFLWSRNQFNFALKLFLELISKAFKNQPRYLWAFRFLLCSKMSLAWNIKMLSKETGLPSQIL